MRFVSRQPSVIAGFMWQPLTPPMVYAMAITAMPKAKAVPTTEAASVPQLRLTAVPQPRSVSTNVPTSSAIYLFFVFSVFCDSVYLIIRVGQGVNNFLL